MTRLRAKINRPKSVTPITENIKAQAHPAHYLMHKYWGRKPHNVIKDYILNHTNPGDTVLDPFMGSGVTIIESVKNNRRAIGVDLNPIACFIVQNTLDKWNEGGFLKTFNRIFNKNLKRFSVFYNTKCPNCKTISTLENSIWENDFLVKIKGRCPKCGLFKKNADNFDQEVYKKSTALFKKLDKANRLYYPKDEVLKYVKRNGKSHLNEFFSERALLILGTLIKDINEVRDKKIKNLLLMCFTSMLPNVSKMIPGNKETVNGRSGWVISKLWAPKIHTEKNIFTSFSGRFNKIRTGKSEVVDMVNPGRAKISNSSADNLGTIKSKSIDYIFTDPPYGDSIAYFGLSMFWNAWLGRKVNYEKEIIYDPYRNKKYEDYGSKMNLVFKELFRVLKDKRYLSFTFHNRNLNIWKAVMDAVRDSGFYIDSVVYQEQAVASGTQGLNRKNTLRGDFVYNLRKDIDRIPPTIQDIQDAESLIIRNVNNWINNKGGYITPDTLYSKLIPLLVDNNAYTDKMGRVVDIEKILKNNFKYNPISDNGISYYAWQNIYKRAYSY